MNRSDYIRLGGSKRVVAAIAALLVLSGALFIVRFVRAERYVYYWDFSTYHGYYSEVGAKFLHNPFKAILSVGGSIRSLDYNYLGAFFLTPFYLAFGAGRVAYILAVYFTYAAAAGVAFAILLQQIDAKSRADGVKRSAPQIIGGLVFASMPALWIPVLEGYVDISGLVVIFVVLIATFRRPLKERHWLELIVLGGLLTILVFLRRWYAYWVVGYFAALLADAVVFERKASQREGLLKTARAIVVVGLAAAVAVAVVATPIAVRMVTTDYRETLFSI